MNKGTQFDLTGFKFREIFPLGEDFSDTAPDGTVLSVNSYYFEKNGKPFFGVSGEMHFSRMSKERWEDELIRMRMSGINIVSTYLFWNYIEQEEGQFDFTGSGDIGTFVRLCMKHGLYVILRIGPFCHGEVRNGGLPDWLYSKPFEVRHTNPGFMECVRRWYLAVGEQVKGLFFREGGPVIGVQLDNEYMHSSAMWEMTAGASEEWVFAGDEGEKYLLELREMALDCGMKPVFFTGTAWGGAAGSDRILPLWGGYAYRPWLFYHESGEHPATEEYLYEDYHRNGAVCRDDFKPTYPPESRPYACCEMGAGMMCSYRYRFRFPYNSADALANIKLASGCNLIGYYMYHGGTNPIAKNGSYMNENQVCRISYDYQAPIGEFGQVRESCMRLSVLHYFTRFFGTELAKMQTVLPENAEDITPENLIPLRCAVRTDGKKGFLFINNFQDHRDMPDRHNEKVCLKTGKEELEFDICLSSGENAVLPFHLDLSGIHLIKATAQPVLKTEIEGRPLYVFMVPDGMAPKFFFEGNVMYSGEGALFPGGWMPLMQDGMELFSVCGNGKEIDILLLSRSRAGEMFLLRDGSLLFTEASLLEDEKGGLRLQSRRNINTVLSIPADRLEHCKNAVRTGETACGAGEYYVSTERVILTLSCEQGVHSRYRLRVNEKIPEKLKDVLLSVRYSGDTGMLFLGNRMISDHFCNGDVWEVGLMEYRKALLNEDLVLRILPVREGRIVDTSSPMAAGNEHFTRLSEEMQSVTLQPVYEIRLC